jgi:hypothetical protein
MPFDEQGRARFQEFQLTAAYVASHPRFRELVEELEESQDVYRDSQQDPMKYLRSKGFELPDGWTVKLSHDSPLMFTVCVNSWCISYTVSLEVTHA